MAKADTEKAPIILRRTPDGLSPVSAFDLEALDKYKIGSEVEVTIKQRRSLPHQRLYWKILAETVKAIDDDRYPNAEKLHEALKMTMGYVTQMFRLDGKIYYVPDSTAFSSMDQQEFADYFEKAMRKIAETFGINPFALGKPDDV